MKIHFWGATDDVTGSMSFVEIEKKIIMIDCGLAQGIASESENINRLQPPHHPKGIEAVVITHAHLDHTGYIPRLVKNGFKGPIYCTPPTAKLMRIILLDSAKLMEDDFYDESDVQNALHMVKTVEWKEEFNLAGAQGVLLPAGHILGASSFIIKHVDKKIAFSGDLGRSDDPLLPPFGPCPEVDAIVMESTYGAKNRNSDIRKELHSFLATISSQERVGIIASFAVARAQTLLTLIHEFFDLHPEYKARIVMDSPMMKDANKIYQQYSSQTMRPENLNEALNEVDAIEFQKEWLSLKKKSGPLIILSSSGMLTGGRISRHLENWQNDSQAILYLPGYQGKGTPGRSLLEGNRLLTGSEGEQFTWIGEVWSSDAYSSHADQRDLLAWATALNKHASIFLIHGEETSKAELRDKLTLEGIPKVNIPIRGSWYPVE